MRTHHIAFYMALALGVVVAIALTITTGFWLDLSIPLGQKGILVFLAAAVTIVLGTEAIAGFVGDRLDDWRLHRRSAR